MAIQFDYAPTAIAFNYRRPGSNNKTANILVSYFDTTVSQEPFYEETIVAYVYSPTTDPGDGSPYDEDGDGWIAYASDLDASFNMVTLSGDKQFAIDDLTVTTVPNDDGDYPEDLIGDSDDDDDSDDDSDDDDDDDDDDDSGCFISTILGRF